MTEYCTVFFTWKPDCTPSNIVEYVVHTDDERSEPLSPGVLELGGHRLQVWRDHNYPESDGIQPSDQRCVMTVQCKPVYAVKIVSFMVASEARIVEVYDCSDCYLQTIRGIRDVQDSEADGSRVHYLCRCILEEPVSGIRVKFLSLGPRESFEIACIRLKLEPCSKPEEANGTAGQGINMAKLRRDVDSMGDTVSERAKAFLTTLENFQKNRQGSVDDIRQLLLSKNMPGTGRHNLAGLTALSAMFTSTISAPSVAAPVAFEQNQNCPSSRTRAEPDTVISSALMKMLSSMAVSQPQDMDTDKVYSFLQSVCGQVSIMRDKEEAEKIHMENEKQKSETIAEAELAPRVLAELDSLVESRMEAVEQRLISRLDMHLAELESRVSSKLDAVLALLQNAASSAK